MFKPGSLGVFETFPRVVTTPTCPAGTTKTLERMTIPPTASTVIPNRFFDIC
jgi:hypothetical protein